MDLSTEELLELIDMKKQLKKENAILQEHIENFYHIWTNDKGAFLSYLPDFTKPKGRKPVTATTKEKLERKIINFYLERQQQEESQKEQERLSTVRNIYPLWLNIKGLETTATSYIRRIDNDWNAYYVNDSIIDMDIRTFTKATLKEWALNKVRDKELTKTQYYNMSMIIRQCLDYAVDHELIPLNPYNQFTVDKKLLKKVKQPEDGTQVFLTNERPLIECEAWLDFEEKGCTSALAIPLAFQLGVRLGELITIKETDISPDGKYLHIQRMVQKQELQRPDGSWYPARWEAVEHTKSSAGDRMIYLTEEARRIIIVILDSNKENGFYDDGFLFIHGGKRINPRAVDTRIRKYCDHINIRQKGLHTIRKTYISSLLDGGININEIRKQVGHEDERTTLKNYCFNRKTNIENESDMEKALAV
ncbi:tyrosine-type recombinase/integrase [Lacrimispora sp. BS-2]|uniref:Tyrosine-type recombinase/integrase n=1 Tax=Lacrimispora sp. BS-2 TaxID=3151850 RepID=A0AAU7PR73_9FIRM